MLILPRYRSRNCRFLGSDGRFVYGSMLLLAMLLTVGKAQGRTATLTTAEIRTLKNAVTVLKYQPQIEALAKNCAADVLQYLPTVIADADTGSLQSLLQKKLNMTSVQLFNLLQENEKFANLTQAAAVSTPDCNDRDAIVDLAEQYSNNYTALELSDALGSWHQHFVTPEATPAMDPDQLSGLISNSHSIVLVNIQPKSVLTSLQQANFLHIDDKSSYVFEVQQGWKAVGPRYQGLHIHLSPKNYPQQPKRWLLLLDTSFHPKTALHGAELQQALQLLGSPAWIFNRQGDLVRAGKS
ncbi:hypothetical protein A5320_11955 [Rheinheimera sp. SA_1]|uniref:hypothetical protein n=1 Tax=Rheinheimera sp. SA_1 TaxID=1827365 RepID=UPI0007FCD4DC|nr:hypothetical protein [Rheinheimera sp. SA_1]OBP14476.1 hypothetical protein A5320_11955 [Rheinheimera sp. SA_1]